MKLSRHKQAFPLSLIKTKGQLYDVENMFLATRAGQSLQTFKDEEENILKAESLGKGKTSFENAVTLFLIGLGTERGLLPSLEEKAFEPKLVNNILDLRNSGHRIECNH